MSSVPDGTEQESGRTLEAAAAVRGSLGLFILQTFGRMTGLLFAMVAGRVLEPALFGRYSAATATAQLVAILGDFGTTAAVTRLVSRGERSPDELLRSVLPWNAVLGALAALIAIGIATTRGSTAGVADVAIVAAAIPLQSMTTSIFGALDGSSRVGTRGLLGFVTLAGQYGGGAVALLMSGNVRTALVFVPAAAALTFLAASTAAIRMGLWTLRFGMDRTQLWPVVRLALPFGALGGISILAARIDLVLLATISGTAETAFYDVGVRTMEAAAYLSAAIAAPVLVLMNTRLSKGDTAGAQRVVAVAVEHALVLGCLVSAITVGASRGVVDILVGAEYGDAVPSFRILGSQVWLVFVVAIQGTVLMAGDRLRPVVALAAGVTSITLALDLLLIPPLGAPGAALATAVGTCSAFVLFSRAIRSWSGIRTPWPAPKLVLALVFGIGAGWLADGLGAPVQIGCAAMGYLIPAVALREIKPRETFSILRSSRRSPGTG